MLGESPRKDQRDLFQPLLTDFINLDHELVKLAEKMDWTYLDQEFAPLYSQTGQPAMPIRFMVGCLLLKRLYNLGDETLAKAWVMNPYMQYFCGEAHFQHEFRCDPSDLVHFRKRLGVEGIERIFTYSVRIHGNRARTRQALSDTTVQENNTTFPTDAKLAKKVIDGGNRIARKEGITQRQTYVRVSKDLVRATHNGHHPRRCKQARKARKKLRTLAGRMLRELERNLPGERLADYAPALELYWKAITQERHDKDKVYSLHKPFTCCIAKGKAHKPYEFGNKIGIITHPTNRIILAVQAFQGNPNDSQTLAPLLQNMDRLGIDQPEELIYDRGGRGPKQIGSVKITTPDPPKAKRDANHKRRMRRRFPRRAGIEPVIGHLKSDFRMEQNYLYGKDSPQINALLVAAGWNLRKWMDQLDKKIKKLFFLLQSWQRTPAYITLNSTS